jgi:hypothetical protein
MVFATIPSGATTRVQHDTANLNILPDVDNTGTVSVGNGTTDIDFKIFLGTTADYALFDVSAGTITLAGTAILPYKVSALTTNTTLNTTHFNGMITNRGAAGALNHTLPTANAALSGVWFEYWGFADQTQTFTASPADSLVILNDASADSIAFASNNQKIGAHSKFVCDGPNWYVAILQGNGTTSP